VKARSDELQIFVSVIECGSISAAAEQVGQTPSAVSRTLSRLEAKLDTTLINRTTRRMDLTGRTPVVTPKKTGRAAAHQCGSAVHAARDPAVHRRVL
jgi:DNA-binding MarR family transcriptional regulator